MEDTNEKLEPVPATLNMLYQLWFTFYLDQNNDGIIQELNQLALVYDEDMPEMQDPTKITVFFTQNFTDAQRQSVFAFTVNVLPMPGKPNPVVKHKWITEAHNLVYEVTAIDGRIEETNLILIPADLTKNKRNYLSSLFCHYEINYSDGKPMGFVFWQRKAFWIAREGYQQRQALQVNPYATTRVYEVNIFGQRTAIYEYRPDKDGFDLIEKEYVLNIKVNGSRLRTFESHNLITIQNYHPKLHLFMEVFAFPASIPFHLLWGLDLLLKDFKGTTESALDGSMQRMMNKGFPHRFKYFMAISAVIWVLLVYIIKTHKQVG